MEENMSTLELLEQRERELYLELGKRNIDDPGRSKIVSELKALSDIRIDFEQTEQNRLNNNAKNDIEEQKLVIESEKVQNERRRMKGDIGKAVLYFIGGFGSMFSSYMLSEWFQRDSQLHRFGEKLHDCIIRK